MPSIDEKLQKFIVESETFRTAIREAFRVADLDGNGVLAPMETAAMTDAVFAHIERELKQYGLEFERPSQAVVKQLLEVADKDGNYVLNEEEFFEFYRQVIRYCATIANRGWTRYLCPMVIGAVIACLAKGTITRKTPENPLECVPALIIGSLFGWFTTYVAGDKKLKTKFFAKDEPSNVRH